ncbi:hypothetical protein AU255_12320 [Methyloprofundus sedimenti]|uniref:Calcineurin-like phosphoesterase domain-containing protein n=1 Tax=Methyloprofundus sedimenti TaxID=1420851 RepID=A0A1V8MAG4_9GAMM|nr:hypothetical protein [Methyloprofundus sedimenti]OQK18559.1 hypothetical protein AU255_12320 [Methyloprofundus sedimenti]
MRNFALITLIAGSIASTTPLVSYADRKHDDDHAERHSHMHKHRVLKVALWGDEFYNDDPEIKSIQIEQTIHSMNKHDLDFTLFAGDTKNGSSECTDQAIGQDTMDIFNSLDVPTLYTLGDNEWTDCHRESNGSMDPLERLAYLRTTFFSANKSQGNHPIDVARQGVLGQAYSENSRFVKSNVEFVALHIPGSNNNLVATEKQCTKKSLRDQAACDAASAEYADRNVQNIAWLTESFAQARDNNNVAIVILIQADIYFPFELSDGIYQEEFLAQLDENNGYTDFFNTLLAETHNFEGQVLLVHGDSHYFKIDKAMFNDDGTLTANFTRVEVFGSKENSWIEMTVDPSSENVFSFAPVILNQAVNQ